MDRPSRDDLPQLLKGHFLLGKLGEGEIAELLAHSRVASFRAGFEIFAKGSPGQSMMAVLRGSVKITSPSFDGKELIFNIIGPGDVFGEIALLDGGERTADAIALTDCELLVIYRRDFLPFLHRRPEIAVMLLETLCRRLRHTSEQVEDLSFVALGSRVAKALLWLARAEGTAADRPLLHITQRELGNMVGGARESVNRQLQAWQKAGLIELGTGSISIRDREGLQRLV